MIFTRWTADKLKRWQATETKYNPEKANNTKYSETKLPWFSGLLPNSASQFTQSTLAVRRVLREDMSLEHFVKSVMSRYSFRRWEGRAFHRGEPGAFVKAWTEPQCWNWPKRAGGGVNCRNVWNFAQGLKFKADFHLKWASVDMNLGGGVQPPPPDNSNPGLYGRDANAFNLHC